MNLDLQVAKDSAITSTQSLIQTLVSAVENGELEGLIPYAVFDKMEKLLKEAKGKIEVHAQEEALKHPTKTFTFSGVDYTVKSGYAQMDYESDVVYVDLKAKLDARKKMLDLVAKTGQEMYGEDGFQVPKVAIKGYTKDSLIVKFK
jgi:hypothetical protein